MFFPLLWCHILHGCRSSSIPLPKLILEFSKYTKYISYLSFHTFSSYARAGGSSKKLVWQILCIQWQFPENNGAAYSQFHISWWGSYPNCTTGSADPVKVEWPWLIRRELCTRANKFYQVQKKSKLCSRLDRCT